MIDAKEIEVKPKRVPRARKVVPGANGAVRVLKVVKLDEDVEGIFQFRYPMGDGKWDRARLNQELEEHRLVRAEKAGHPKFCELKDCWAEATDKTFCTPAHRQIALKAHDRLLNF